MGDGYENTTSRVEMTCSECGYAWKPIIASIIYQETGCPSCAGNAPLTEEFFNAKLKEVSGGTIKLLGKFINGSTTTIVKCQHNDCQNEWPVKPYRLICSSPTGCPGCTETGFNHLQPAWIYLMSRGDELQFGITNDLPGRLSTHRRNGWQHLDSFGACSGSTIYNKESELRIWLKESIGLKIDGRYENWFRQDLSVNTLKDLFKYSSIQPLTAEDIIPEEKYKPKRTEQDSGEDVYPKEWDQLPASKLEAYEKGLTRFFTGKRCRQGHLSPRWASGPCCECTSIALKRTTQRAKDARAQAIIDANEYRTCPECGIQFLRTPEMREDKKYCSNKCAGADSKRNYEINNPEKVKESKRRYYNKNQAKGV